MLRRTCRWVIIDAHTRSRRLQSRVLLNGQHPAVEVVTTSAS
jgi:hypothetical protein